MKRDPFYTTNTIELSQPLGTFYVFKINAKKLVEVAFSMAAHNQNGKLTGVQRKLKEDRIKQIALYCNSVNSTFPNSVILSANFNNEGELVLDDDIRWSIVKERLVIPTDQPLASIIDGQHRLEGIREAIKSNNFNDFDVLCSVFIDMPFSEQAEVFTSINFNQRKIDKSIAYELFGYDLNETDKDHWSPDTLSIYFARILNNDKSSPLKGKIYTSFKGAEKNNDWFFSTACVVESISLLFTNNATKDRYYINQSTFFNKGRKRLLDIKNNNSPLRSLYIEGKDKDIFSIIEKYLGKLNQLGWFSSSELVTTKAIGLIAIFEVLKDILNKRNPNEYLLLNFDFLSRVDLEELNKNNFIFSAIGKNQIKNLILNSIY